LSFCTFSFDHWVICSSSIYELLLPLWYQEKVQKDKQRSTKHTYKTKDRVTRTPLKIGGELRCSGRVGSSCSTSDIRRVTLVTNPVHCEGYSISMLHLFSEFSQFDCILLIFFIFQLLGVFLACAVWKREETED
jgi:hypothetical protein